MPENNMVIIGDEDVIMGFAAMGFKARPLKGAAEFSGIVDEEAANQCGICLVQEDIYRANTDKINSYKNLAFPIFIPFSRDKGTGLLDEIVRDIRIKATGAF